MAEEFEGNCDQPIHKRRLAEIWFAAHLRNDVIAGFQHADRRQNPAPFLAFDFERAQTRKVDCRPNSEHNDKRPGSGHWLSFTKRASIAKPILVVETDRT